MNASRRYWAPKTAPSNVRLILAVDLGPDAAAAPAGSPSAVTETRHREAMAAKVARLVAQAGEEAAAVLEASAENLPELEAIRSSQPQAEWPTALMNSESMMALLNQIDWTREGKGPTPLNPTQAAIKSALREQTLRDLIEAL